MGATAIIVTTNVPQVADMCRKLLPMPQIVCNVVEAIGTRDAVNVTVSYKPNSDCVKSQLAME